eukprot:CAMPEP_0184022468 /NCGR_PEP_ID=MMETSP0954-20121128/10625_1 /TAXON_ID=627963 /ORGANISM="Aplanochytrium sp, Strain PBS07" /LENGTH=121 /DNA_ID=CAMNT_0026304851 /DNA_START=129 /DNA_END=494 /DNA_ORIENTATION=-
MIRGSRPLTSVNKGFRRTRLFATAAAGKKKRSGKRVTASERMNYVSTRKLQPPLPKHETCVVLENGATFPMWYSHPSVTPGKLVLASDTSNTTLWMSPKQLERRRQEAIKASESGKFGQKK